MSFDLLISFPILIVVPFLFYHVLLHTCTNMLFIIVKYFVRLPQEFMMNMNGGSFVLMVVLAKV